MSITDGFTMVTDLALNTADNATVSLGTGSQVDINAYTWAAVSGMNGAYQLTLQTGLTAALGQMDILIEDVDKCLPIHARFFTVEEVVYDALYANNAAGFLATSTLTIAEPAQGKPTSTPTAEQILNYLYVQLIRNKTVTRSDGTDFFYVYNDAGTAIYKKAIADAASIFTVSESETGP